MHQIAEQQTQQPLPQIRITLKDLVNCSNEQVVKLEQYNGPLVDLEEEPPIQEQSTLLFLQITSSLAPSMSSKTL